MSKNNKINKEKIIDNKVANLNANLNKYTFTNSLKANISNLKELFVDDDLFIIREV
jgi:hypothetical protein